MEVFCLFYTFRPKLLVWWQAAWPTVPANSQPIEAIAGVTQADVDAVRTVLNNEYGFDPGPFATTDLDEDEKRLLKFDWLINEDHRVVASYQYAKTDVLFDDFPTSAALNSNRYNINQEMTAVSAQLFSFWTDNFSTEIKIANKDVVRRDKSVDGSTNEFRVTAPGGGFIFAGGDRIHTCMSRFFTMYSGADQVEQVRVGSPRPHHVAQADFGVSKKAYLQVAVCGDP